MRKSGLAVGKRRCIGDGGGNLFLNLNESDSYWKFDNVSNEARRKRADEIEP